MEATWKADDGSIFFADGTWIRVGDRLKAEVVVSKHAAEVDARDEWKEIAQGEVETNVELRGKLAELQRRLDAVVMEHIRTAELKCYCEFDRDHERTMECEYCEEVTALRAIAEGRTA